MTREEIIRMAREAGWTEYSLLHPVEVRRLKQFAELVAAYEREECAKAAIDYYEIGWHPSCAAAIRARGET